MTTAILRCLERKPMHTTMQTLGGSRSSRQRGRVHPEHSCARAPRRPAGSADAAAMQHLRTRLRMISAAGNRY